MNLDNEALPPLPKRPLTSYNIFSILERNYILQQHEKSIGDVDRKNTQDSNFDPYASERPERYRDVILPNNWFVVGMNRTKRANHKIHGLITFKELSKKISKQWNLADNEVKNYCKKIAADELERYREKQEEYKRRYGSEAFDSRKRVYKKRANTDTDNRKTKRTTLTVGNKNHRKTSESTPKNDKQLVRQHIFEGFTNQQRNMSPSIAGFMASINTPSFDLKQASADFMPSINESNPAYTLANRNTIGGFISSINESSTADFIRSKTRSIGCIGGFSSAADYTKKTAHYFSPCPSSLTELLRGDIPSSKSISKDVTAARVNLQAAPEYNASSITELLRANTERSNYSSGESLGSVLSSRMSLPTSAPMTIISTDLLRADTAGSMSSFGISFADYLRQGILDSSARAILDATSKVYTPTELLRTNTVESKASFGIPADDPIPIGQEIANIFNRDRKNTLELLSASESYSPLKRRSTCSFSTDLLHANTGESKNNV